MRLNKPIGILLLLWPTLWAIWLSSEGTPNIKICVIFILGVIIMRSAGCVINDIADRNFDVHVARTHTRPLTTGQVSLKGAWLLFLLLVGLAFALVLLTNTFTILLAPIALAIASVYPFMKRITHLPQLVLGAAFAWAIPMAYTAQSNQLPGIAWWLFLATVFLAIAYDTLYAMVDREDDLKLGLKSTAILFARFDTRMVALCHAITLGILGYVGWYYQLNTYYYSSLGLALGLALYQQWLIRHRDGQACFRAFINNHVLAMVIFVGIVVDYWAR